MRLTTSAADRPAHMGESSRDEAAETSIVVAVNPCEVRFEAVQVPVKLLDHQRCRVAERDDAAGIAAFFGGAVHALGGTFEELAALIGGDDGVDIEVEGIVDVLVGGAERDSDGLEQPTPKSCYWR